MPVFDLRSLVTQLGREFARRGMQEHVGALREFYKREIQQPPPERGWTVEVVLEWFARMQIGAFAGIYRVLRKPPRRCPFCEVRQRMPRRPSWWRRAGTAARRCDVRSAAGDGSISRTDRLTSEVGSVRPRHRAHASEKALGEIWGAPKNTRINHWNL
jgi:hypothetical protein